MEIQDIPAPSEASAHRHSVANDVLLRRLDLIFVGIPKRVTETLHILEAHLVAKVGRMGRHFVDGLLAVGMGARTDFDRRHEMDAFGFI